MDQLLTDLGPVTAVIGAQWGDEGKGKIVDILAEHYDVIARACGGANAGHTIVVNGKKHVFRLLPSGSLHEGKPVFLGTGMVIHLPTLLEEIELLENEGIEIADRLILSHASHVLFDYHKEVDAALEAERTQSKGKGIGTTKRGIGPAYMDKAERAGLRMEILAWDKQSITEAITDRAKALEKRYGITADPKKEIDQVLQAKEKLQGRLTTSPTDIFAFLEEGMTLLIEGAQATLLDTDHGTYPYVTSSSTTIAGALQGLGLPPQILTSCIGVAKAYCTRVGEGDFNTEVGGETGDRLREKGGEYGAVTGRPRRCGWLNVADLHTTALLNGFTHWNITKLDVLDEEAKIPVAIGVDDNGDTFFDELEGWKSSTAGMKSYDDLPELAQEYIEFIEEHTGVPVALIGTGQGREEMIVCE